MDDGVFEFSSQFFCRSIRLCCQIQTAPFRHLPQRFIRQTHTVWRLDDSNQTLCWSKKDNTHTHSKSFAQSTIHRRKKDRNGKMHITNRISCSQPQSNGNDMYASNNKKTKKPNLNQFFDKRTMVKPKKRALFVCAPIKKFQAKNNLNTTQIAFSTIYALATLGLVLIIKKEKQFSLVEIPPGLLNCKSAARRGLTHSHIYPNEIEPVHIFFLLCLIHWVKRTKGMDDYLLCT